MTVTASSRSAANLQGPKCLNHLWIVKFREISSICPVLCSKYKYKEHKNTKHKINVKCLYIYTIKGIQKCTLWHAGNTKWSQQLPIKSTHSLQSTKHNKCFYIQKEYMYTDCIFFFLHDDKIYSKKSYVKTDMQDKPVKSSNKTFVAKIGYHCTHVIVSTFILYCVHLQGSVQNTVIVL